MKGTVLITGASYGIGRELALIFTREGYRPILAARSADKLQALADELSQKFSAEPVMIEIDLAAEDAAWTLFRKVEDLGLTVDILVNNAGVGLHGLFEETDARKESAMIRLNVLTLTALCKLFLPGIKKRGGKILNVASTAAFQPGPLMAVYYATKAYVLHFSEAIAEELRGSGVQVTCLCPGPTRTEFQERAGIGKVPIFTYASMGAKKVAEAGYRGLMAGKTLVIPGFLNWLTAFSVRLSPRPLAVKIVRFLQSERARTKSL